MKLGLRWAMQDHWPSGVTYHSLRSISVGKINKGSLPLIPGCEGNNNNILYFLQNLMSIQKDKYIVKYNTNTKKRNRTYKTHIYINKLNHGILY